MLTKAYIPYRGYYCTPFCRWQGSMANENSIVLGANTAKRWLAEKKWDPKMFDYLFLGITIGQHHIFYGSTWAAVMMGAGDLAGMTISQACSTSTTCVFQAALGIETGLYNNAFSLLTDRCSNGPHTIWPNPMGPGGEVISENWNMDNFNHDPSAGNAMIQTAENVARDAGITREQCDAFVVKKFNQYEDSLSNGRSFKKRYLFPAQARISRKKTVLIEDDEGITPSNSEGLAKLKPVLSGGVHTYGAQTHPADGNAGIMVTTRNNAKELSAAPDVEIQVVSYGYARARKGYMAMAVVPAVKMALEKAGISIDDVKTIKTHNPFAVNDIYLAQQMHIDTNDFNNYGSPLIYGHPQGPTAGRCIIEGIEETAIKGGGYLLFGGCAAGDTGAALVLKIG